MDYYKKNLKVLRQGSPVLYTTVTASVPVHQAVTQLIADADNLLVKTAVGECYLHSMYQRDRELAHICSGISANTQVVILFGLGLGDALDYLGKNFPDLEHVIVIEPNIDAFKAFLSHHDLQSIVGSLKKVSFLVNQTAAVTLASLNQLLHDELYRQPELVASISYRTLYDEYYQSVRQGIITIVRLMLVNLVTKRSSTRNWLINAWRNLQHDNLGLEAVMSRIMPLPIIIVSAGPSLNQNIHLLAEAKNKALIIAVGSAIKILESHGITPHFRMAFDGNTTNKLLFDGVDTAKCPLIYSDALFHEILPQYSGEKLQMVLDTDYLTQYFRKKQKHKTVLVSSGLSIANIAFDMACKWNCSKVILVGQDLCYTDNTMHAKGSWADGRTLVIKQENMIKTQDIHGQEVFTTKAYLGMKDLFEDMIRRYPVECINASEGGLPIHGSRNKSLQQVLKDDLTQNKDIAALIDKALKQAHIAKYQEKDTSLAAILTLETDLQTISLIYQDSLTTLQAVQSMLNHNQEPKDILRELEKMEQYIQKLQQLDYYRLVIHRYLEDGFRAIQASLEYTGNDESKRVEALHKIYAGQAVELQKIINISQKLLEEYKVSQNDPALLADYCLWLLH